MPAPCSLLLEVYAPISIYDLTFATIDWEVSTDPSHEFPYLMEIARYAEQDIDPVRCTASIGTIEVGVIDKEQTPGDQTTGFMTARVIDLLGRRCRLRRYINDTIGWVTIADGPAGPPRMDASYAGYRWNIRDTRETERKLQSFMIGGVSGVVPRGPIYGFGRYLNDLGDEQVLRTPLMDRPILGVYQISALGSKTLGLINLADHFADVGGPVPSVDDSAMRMDKDALEAVQISEVAHNLWGSPNADVLWRVFGEEQWNVARPVSSPELRQPFVGTVEALASGDTDPDLFADYITLFVDDAIPESFPGVSELVVEAIVRYRGPASEAFPYYVEGTLGDVLKDLYDGVFALPPTRGIHGLTYDPAQLDFVGTGYLTRILYDPDAMDHLTDAVLLRQTDGVSDTRAWSESNLYAPSGWIPALGPDMHIAPVSRVSPHAADINTALQLTNAITAPSSDWQFGERTVSQIVYTYPRFFVPTVDSIKVAPDGLAIRNIDIEFEDLDSSLRYGPQIEQYDASAFGAVGTDEGLVLPSQQETASLLAQAAKFDVLDRYRGGAQSLKVMARRSHLVYVKVGDWIPWSLMQLPSRITGLRGSHVTAAQIISIRDDDCVWRSITLEESQLSDGPPGLVIDLVREDDRPSTGGSSLIVLSDVESL